VIGLDIVRAKLALATPRILATNQAMVITILAQTKAATTAATPLGPGHFGYHLRNTFRTEIQSKGTGTVGKLLGAPQGYWREYGTGARYRGPNRLRRYVGAVERASSISTGGERAFMTAHKAAGGFKGIVAAFYSGLARWWGLGTLKLPRAR